MQFCFPLCIGAIKPRREQVAKLGELEEQRARHVAELEKMLEAAEQLLGYVRAGLEEIASDTLQADTSSNCWQEP